MTAAESLHTAPQSRRFLYLYALAVSGGAVAYVPFLTILLPNQATLLAGKGALQLLAQIAFIGAIAASLANILFGWASDKTRSRRPWIVAGLVVICALLPLMQFAPSQTVLIGMVLFWQFGLNMLLAPLSAWAGDTVPDTQKGLLGGLLAFAPAFGALSGALVTFPGLASDGVRLVIVAGLVLVMVSPALIWGRPEPMPQLVIGRDAQLSHSNQATKSRRALAQMWIARLLVQVAEASLFAFLLLWLRSIDPNFADNEAATIFALVLCAAVVLTLFVGRWSDRHDRPILPLTICASLASAGLFIMAFADTLFGAISGYIVFAVTGSTFLALHSSQTLRVLPAPATRGRDLGFFNLTNTVPSLVMPWLTMAMVPIYGFDALFLLLAMLSALAAILLSQMPRQPAV
jgi:MFS family permease